LAGDVTDHEWRVDHGVGVAEFEQVENDHASPAARRARKVGDPIYPAPPVTGTEPEFNTRAASSMGRSRSAGTPVVSVVASWARSVGDAARWHRRVWGTWQSPVRRVVSSRFPYSCCHNDDGATVTPVESHRAVRRCQDELVRLRRGLLDTHLHPHTVNMEEIP
jgi:hypothetical protein